MKIFAHVSYTESIFDLTVDDSYISPACWLPRTKQNGVINQKVST